MTSGLRLLRVDRSAASRGANERADTQRANTVIVNDALARRYFGSAATAIGEPSAFAVDPFSLPG
jgi:hypothetical protein